jgi:hypothetical protein
MVNYHPFFILLGDELEFFRNYNIGISTNIIILKEGI